MAVVYCLAGLNYLKMIISPMRIMHFYDSGTRDDTPFEREQNQAIVLLDERVLAVPNE
jgi:hypothetical protein